MTCHECGSDIAEIDVFCPFCGISLEPVAIPDVQVDDSMESTIMMPQPPAEDLAKSEPAENTIEADDVLIDDIPVPAILSDAKTVDNIAASSTSEYHLLTQDVVKIEDQAADLQQTTSEPAIEHSEAELAANSEHEESQPLESEAIEVQEAALTSSDQVDEEIPEVAVSLDDIIAEEADSASLAAIHDSRPPTSGSLYEERIPSNFEGIAKPSEEFESADSYASNSTFDSVRIMENRPPSLPDNINTRIQPEGGQSSKPASNAAADVENPGASAGQAEISSTSHGIGVGDTDGKKSAKLKPLTEGTILNGRYEIVRKIGGGGMGAVYLASDNNLGGVLRAVKEMVQAHIEEEQQEKAINDFKRESMILSSLDHVSIPTIYDYFYDDKESRFYLVMKYISGGDLSSRLRSAQEGKIDEKSVCEWAVQIIDVLDYLHNQPSTIVYRDLKPSNIMIDGNSGRAMLIDFGIARSINKKEEKGVTAVGTMGYAPPELFSGNVEPRSDIYSLGSTMFHLLTGADPQSNPLLIFDFQKNPRPRQINPQLSDQVERILMKSVEYNADSRFASAAEMREVLEEHLIKLKNGIVTYGVTEIPASVSLANQSVFCGFCGQRIVATDLFCAFCGAKQPIAQQGVHSEIYAQGSWTAKLVIEGTSELAAPAFSLQKDDNLLGRRDPMSNIFPEVDLSKYDPQTKISRKHARIWREGNNFMVEDLGSSNGTILARSANDTFRLVPNQPHVLTAGDKIRVGDATLHFVIG
ncbi:MAG: protein kinase [Pyrinomonadaceae bacterium]